MFVRRLALFFLFLTICLKAFPAVFTVTSNADSGPGTLRDALTLAAANGIITQDIIQFNFLDQSTAGRTITLVSQLPDVSSNLIIDGSTQSGVKFGVSDARVALFFQTPIEQTLSGLRISNQHDVIILGLYIKNLADVSKASQSYSWRGIDIVESYNIQVGQAGKGNVITGFYLPLSTNWLNTGTVSCRNISIKSSFFNIDADGETLPTDQEGPVDLNDVAGQIKVGGTPNEGNVLAYGLSVTQQHSYSAYDTVSANFIIDNNKIGVDYNVQTAISNSVGIYAGNSGPYGNSSFLIEDNVIVGSQVFGDAIFMVNIGQKITILRNYIGTDKSKTKTLKTGGIFVYWCTGQVAIGSTDKVDANYITNCNPVTIWPYTNCTVNKNTFYCTVNQQPMHDASVATAGVFAPPDIKILSITGSSVSGTATPNSSIELFYSDICKTCSPQTYFASTAADVNGNWKYNGPITGAVIASATLGQNTSNFTQTTINTDNVKIINACSDNGLGSITGAIPTSATSIKWVNDQGKVVSTTADLVNVKPGKYKLVVTNGGCGDSTSFFEIKIRFQIDTSSIKKINPSCGNSSGAISGINVINNELDQPAFGWKDAGGNIIANTLALQNLPAGSYYLSVTSNDQTCSQILGPFVLKNLTGPNIDQTHANITSTNCGQSTGAITNIQVTGSGTLQYSWLNDQQQQVATTKDLTGQPAGTYKLQVTDDSQCGPIFSTDILIPETNGISLDDSKVQTTIASCGMDNGTITGMQVTGTAQYKWTDASNNIVATTFDLQNAAPGDYTFTAYNNSGCSKTSKTYHVGMQAVTQYPSYTVNSTPACSGQSNGSINISSDAVVASLRWVNSQGQNIGSSQLLNNVPKGTYQLYFTDANGCETLYNTYTVTELQPLSVASQGQVMSDQCGLKTGAINNIAVIGGQSPYTYTWTDAAGNQIGTGNSLSNLAAGDYHLNIADSRCGSLTVNYTITSQSEYVAAPPVSDVQLCSSGDAFISVNNPSSTFTYRLYDDQSNAQPLDEENSGRFKVTISNNRSYFISQLSGSCESSRSEIKVTVGVSAVGIPNAFTPNGDGINDYWSLKGMENNPNSLVQVFTRYGQKVFESKGYSHPFDGTYGGKELPTGVYYYIINLGTNCNILSGDVTIIR